jgi:hypothetical protein
VRIALLGGALAAAAAVSVFAASRPDPNIQAMQDGCVRDYLATVRRESPTWVYVNDRDTKREEPPPEPRWLRGVIDGYHPKYLGVHPTPEDVPTVHDSYDFNFDVRPNSSDDYLLGVGNFAGRGTSSRRIHVEREQLALPSFAWPELGDRVTILGNWVWDCGHWSGGGERTEIHSYRVLWLQRNPGGPSPNSPRGEAEADLLLSTEETYAGVEADCAHKTKGDRLAFRACLDREPDWQDVSGIYRFSVAAPPRPPGAVLTWRIVDRGSQVRPVPDLFVRPSNGRLIVDVMLKSPVGSRTVFAKQIFVGWSRPPRARPIHLRMTFPRLLIRRAMDPGCPSSRPRCPTRQTTIKEQVTAAPGEWNVYWDVAGVWGMWPPRVLRPRDGSVFRGRHAIDFYVGPNTPWRLFVFTRECDFGSLGSASGAGRRLAPCPHTSEFGSFEGDDTPGVIVRRFHGARELGTRTLRPLAAGSTCPRVNRRGCYALTYRLVRLNG